VSGSDIPDKAWKQFERRTSKDVGTTRIPVPARAFTHHLYDPLSRTWRATAASHLNVYFTTATLLQGGTVLMAGTNYCCSGSSDLFDPLTETWKLTRNVLQRPRQHHSAVPLNDGTVLVIGGYYEGPPCDEGTCTPNPLSSAEIFTPGGA
jgi:hypothetical protein